MLSYPVRVAVHKNLICQSYAQSSYAMANLNIYGAFTCVYHYCIVGIFWRGSILVKLKIFLSFA